MNANERSLTSGHFYTAPGTPPFTVIDGDTWEKVMAVVQRAVEAVAAHAPRVSTVIKVDWRQGTVDAMTNKVDSVERYLSDREA
jgi:uncharacterized protein YqgV (UPF0045/DUF77 family)